MVSRDSVITLSHIVIIIVNTINRSSENFATLFVLCFPFVNTVNTHTQLNGSHGEVTESDDMSLARDMPRKSNILNHGSNGRVGVAPPPQPPAPRPLTVGERIKRIEAFLDTSGESPRITAKGGGSRVIQPLAGGAPRVVPCAIPPRGPPALPPPAPLPPSQILPAVPLIVPSAPPPVVAPPPPIAAPSIEDDEAPWRETYEQLPATLEDDEFPWSDTKDYTNLKNVLLGVNTPGQYGFWDDFQHRAHFPLTVAGSAVSGTSLAYLGHLTMYAHLGPIAPIAISASLGAVGYIAPFVRWFLTARWQPAYIVAPGVVDAQGNGALDEEHGDWVSHAVDTIGQPTDYFRAADRVEERLVFDLSSLGYNSLHRLTVDMRIVNYLRLANSSVNSHSYGAFKFQVTSALPAVCKEISCHLLDRSVMYAVQCVQVTQLRAAHRLTGVTTGVLSLDPKKLL